MDRRGGERGEGETEKIGGGGRKKEGLNKDREKHGGRKGGCIKKD